jgi:serine/threonine-protein kinase
MNETEQHWQRVASVFDAVVELPPAERAAALTKLCEGDAALHDEVAALLRADAFADGVDHAIDLARTRAATEWVDERDQPAAGGARIGPWRIERELGRGGMGVVFLVERADGQFQQRAALKLIKRGMESEAVLARFLRERQLLARLTHRNIASLLDGGLSADGRPYFVMEYVEGLPLPAYCAEHALDPAARIRLLRQVCEAVQFAHRRLVVHRDIKPANVLVTAGGEVKLLDFGIAKLLDTDADGYLTQTDARLRPFTPAYAAPEQMRGEPVTTATDIYSLGCLLYEVLTGTPRHVAGEAESSRGSAPRESTAARQAAKPRLRGDLDTIVSTALQPEPERRYATASALGDDLGRYLDGLPITARRDSVWYRSTRFIGRHRTGVAVFGLAIAGLIAATVLALASAAHAREEARRTAAVSGFLIDIFRVADPKRMPGGAKLSALDILDAGTQRLDAQLAGQPQLATRFAQVLGTIYAELGQYDRAIALLRRALDSHDAGDGDTADTLSLLARAEYEKGDYADAAKDADAAWAAHRAHAGPRSGAAAADIALQGEIARRQGDFGRAETLLTEALAMSRETLKSPHAQIAGMLNKLAALKGDMRQIDAGAALTEQALAMYRSLYGENHLDVAENLSNLGDFRMQSERLAEAPALFEQATAIYRRLLPGDHPLLAVTISTHARALDRLEHYAEAAPLYDEALAMQRRLLGEHHPDIATTLNNIALLRVHQDDYAGGAEYSRRALAVWSALGQPEHPFALGSKANLAVALREAGDLAEAERLLRDVLDARRRQLGERHMLVSFTLDPLAIVLRLQGRAAEAVALHRQAQAMREGMPGLPVTETALARMHYALSLADSGDLAAAREQVRQALQGVHAAKPASAAQIATVQLAEARIALAQGDVDAGCADADAALAARPADAGAAGWRHAEAQAVQGACRVARGDGERGRSEQRAALAALERVRGPDHWMTRQVRGALREGVSQGTASTSH